MPRKDKEEIVFASGGTWATKTAGTVLCLLGLGLVAAAFTGYGDMPIGPVPVYLAGGLCAAAGVGFFLYRSERRFSTAFGKWRVSWKAGPFWGGREGALSDLSEIIVDCYVAATDPPDSQGPYLYEVLVTLEDGGTIAVERGLMHAHHAFCIANALSSGLSLPLVNRAGGKGNIVEVDPPENAPEPRGRLSTGWFDGHSAAFHIPSGRRLEKKYRISMVITLMVITAPLWGISVFAAFVSWDWLSAWLRLDDSRGLWNSMIAALFVVLPLFAVYLIFMRIFMAREELRASPSGITYRRIYGRWSREERIARGKITDIKIRVNNYAPSPRMEDIAIFAGPDTILVGHGLPDEEKAWIASMLRKILGIHRS